MPVRPAKNLPRIRIVSWEKSKSANQGQFSISDRDANTPYIKNIRVVTTIE